MQISIRSARLIIHRDLFELTTAITAAKRKEKASCTGTCWSRDSVVSRVILSVCGRSVVDSRLFVASFESARLICRRRRAMRDRVAPSSLAGIKASPVQAGHR